MKKPVLISDLFCGAGGTSTGAEKAIKELGRTMVLVCVNHWEVAIETHKKNHPSARHYVQDVEVADPEQLVPEGYLDLLMASPECRFHSRARGGKPVHDQGRMNPWAILRWLTTLRVRCLLVENVPEFVFWGPLLPDGRPDPRHKGEFFQAWVFAIQKAGYRAEWRMLNAADHGDATTRVRFFLIARRDRRPIRWPEATHSPTGEETIGGRRIKWRAAREIIDWQDVGRSLFDDAKYKRTPLSPKTLSRIAKGLAKFGGPLAPLYIHLLGVDGNGHGNGDGEPFVLSKHAGGNQPRSIDDPIPAADTRGAGYLVEPFISPYYGIDAEHGARAHDVDDPLRTQGTSNRFGLVQPFILGKQSSPSIRGVDQPIPTVTTDGAQLLVEPFVYGQNSGSVPRSSDKPIPTITSVARIALVKPSLIKYNSTGGPRDVDKPLDALTTKERYAVANPIIVPFRGERDGQEPRAHSVDEPAPAITTKKGLGLAEPVLVEVNHDGHDGGESIERPLGTVTSKRGRAIVIPFIVQTDQAGPDRRFALRSVEEPLPTVITRKNKGLIEAGLAEVVLTEAEGEEGVDPRRLVLVDGELRILDIRFRMLSNLELARAMGFTDDESTYEFVGNKSEVTKQIGNAVPVHLAAALVKAILST